MRVADARCAKSRRRGREVCCAAPAARTPNKPDCGRRWPRWWSGKGIGREVEKVLGESQKALGDSAMQRIIQANYLALRYGKEAKDRLRKLAENSEKFSDAERLQLWAGLLEPAAQVGDMAASRTLLPEDRREAARQRPSPVHAVPAGADGRRSSRHGAGARRYSARRRPKRLLAVGPGDSARHAIQQAEGSGAGVGAGVEVSGQGARTERRLAAHSAGHGANL